MKTLKLIIIVVLFCVANTIQAQVSVNVNLNPPLWGPVGYTDVRYYYLPDVEAYYDVQTSVFIYNRGGKWIRRRHLPAQYNTYDLYSGYKVVMSDYRGNTPYNDFKSHKIKYAKGYHDKSQKTIGNKPGKGNSKPTSYSKNPSNKNATPAQGNNKNANSSNSYENKKQNSSKGNKGNNNKVNKGPGKTSGGGKGKK